jgi:hypothetical protein
VSAATVALAVVYTGCGGGGSDKPAPTSSPTTASVAVTLPPGELSNLVLQPQELSDGFVALPAQTGPADIARIASFSAAVPAAEKALRDHGFQAGYVVEYLDEGTGRFVVNVMTRFRDADGARADLTADLDRLAAGATPVAVGTIGDQSGGSRIPYRDAGPTGELLSIRFRVGATTVVLSLGGRKAVDLADAQGLARVVAQRLGAPAPTGSPS